MTAPFVDTAGARRVMVSVCQRGPVYCLDGKGKIVWQKTQKEVSHGQAVWVGNFVPKRKGLETIVLKDGHYGIFGTYDAATGEALGGFEHRSGLRRPSGQRNYPDMPVRVRWPAGKRNALWIPGDRALVDGMGNVLADLGPSDEKIRRALNAGQSKKQMNVQAIAVHLYDDERDDLVLYQPVGGRAMVYIVGEPDKKGTMKPYRHEAHVYNRKSYF